MKQQRSQLKTRVFKRSVFIQGHKTSISLEDEFWSALQAIASLEKIAVSKVVEQINGNRNNPNLSSAIRVYLLKHVRHRITLENVNAVRDILAK